MYTIARSNSSGSHTYRDIKRSRCYDDKTKSLPWCTRWNLRTSTLVGAIFRSREQNLNAPEFITVNHMTLNLQGSYIPCNPDDPRNRRSSFRPQEPRAIKLGTVQDKTHTCVHAILWDWQGAHGHVDLQIFFSPQTKTSCFHVCIRILKISVRMYILLCVHNALSFTLAVRLIRNTSPLQSWSLDAVTTYGQCTVAETSKRSTSLWGRVCN